MQLWFLRARTKYPVQFSPFKELTKYKNSNSGGMVAKNTGKKPSLEVCKNNGDKSFKEERYKEAMEFYSQAIEIFDEQEEGRVGSNQDERELVVKVLLNRSRTFFKQKMYRAAIKDAERVVKFVPKDKKGHYLMVRRMPLHIRPLIALFPFLFPIHI